MNEYQAQQVVDALKALVEKITIISSQLDYIAQQITPKPQAE
jgi:hypothetical protein